MLLCVLLQQQQLNLVFFKCRVMCLRCVGVFFSSDVEECFQFDYTKYRKFFSGDDS